MLVQLKGIHRVRVKFASGARKLEPPLMQLPLPFADPRHAAVEVRRVEELALRLGDRAVHGAGTNLAAAQIGGDCL
jgi:hypothetical protein